MPSAERSIWDKQWSELIQKALQQLSHADIQTKSRFSDGLAEIPYTAIRKSREVVEKLRRLMERIGLRG